MGQASSHALGLALGRPDKRVIVLDGDGSLLMNLGSLVTIAEVAPRNLIHFVCENDTYEANGGHPIPGAGRISFAAFARAAGYRSVYEFADLAAFGESIGAVLSRWRNLSAGFSRVTQRRVTTPVRCGAGQVLTGRPSQHLHGV